ncbi:MAE_28990/MAE_18760 family HEPN-like nuclease [Serratia symbiotica]|uniref:MAE_28990/MAE_18760 family HEPN-like nuclease n=1 Tax=Serratia symbiotica TaxID=138074 RepID=UPI00136BAFB5|nr:MAE_28990/MAE_18760 family HEPN-like nuclease [Serratia symbiotica]MBQ0955669.1 hypothetical protein [Serratia symbiotica]
MQNVRDDFDIRSNEILGFLALIQFLEDAGNEISSTSDPSNKYNITSDVRKTMKGTVYILLYNLVESTMREAISHIHDSLTSKKVEYDNLCDSLKKEILRRIKNDTVKLDSILINTKSGLGQNLSFATFNKKKLFSGNIDREEINDKSKIYGFSTNCDYRHTKHGEKLTTIKQNRNDLAHGNVSFSEIGKGVSVSELGKTSSEAIAYLEAIIINIESYLNNDGYLHKTA